MDRATTPDTQNVPTTQPATATASTAIVSTAVVSSAGVRISGADRVRRSAAGGWVLDAPRHRPAPHHEHRPKPIYPDDLRDASAFDEVDLEGNSGVDDEPVWEGASRMLKRLASARRLHPAGRARAPQAHDVAPS